MKPTLALSFLTLSLLVGCGKNHYLIQDPIKKSMTNFEIDPAGYCKENPLATECKIVDEDICKTNPSDPSCKIDDGDLCKTTPTAPACDFKPVVLKPGVVTILLALGDMANEGVVINEESSRLITQNAVKFASPVENPKILVVKDYLHFGESVEDTEFIAEKLLANYEVELKYESAEGLTDADLVGFDVVLFNNPGHPFSNIKSLEVLKNFKGGVILTGDDMSRVKRVGTAMEEFTGLKHIDNGTDVQCDGKYFIFDNNLEHRYRVTLEEQFLPGLDESVRNFEYGNDIDNSVLAYTDSKYEVLAYANGAQELVKSRDQ